MSFVRILRAKVSDGATALNSKLVELGHNSKKIKITGSRYRGKTGQFVINWGSTAAGTITDAPIMLNSPEAVVLASDKVKTFQTLKRADMGQNIPRFTTSTAEAGRWITEDLEDVYCRTLTRASEGRGIVIATDIDELVSAPLYTAKVEVERELRVHVVRGEVIDFAQKKKMSSERREEENIDEVNTDIRSHNNGWVFARVGVELSESTRDVAIKAIGALGLDFGAVDIAITPQGVAKVYEVNTAPGLEGTTLDSYANALSGCLT